MTTMVPVGLWVVGISIRTSECLRTSRRAVAIPTPGTIPITLRFHPRQFVSRCRRWTRTWEWARLAGCRTLPVVAIQAVADIKLLQLPAVALPPQGLHDLE